ncbi:MAG: Na+/H+ antiporter NhaA [Gammaproteobacteria bacterium]|nr:MAG: Na+/H+ antiporter NhaA [Gammaproteobacteria bacterium]
MKNIAFTKNKVEPKNAWEANFGRVVTPFEEFIRGETNSGMLLVICTAIALVIANSPLYHTYEHLLATKFLIGTGNFNIQLSLHHVINDGLMTAFFFLVGLEIKREVLVGELSDFKKALLPICAAVGGMVIPALFYFIFNTSGPGVDGWGIPMATDIAFAVTALVLLGNRIPKPLMTFLIALAIVDDMGAVLVIAIFYTADISIMALAGAAVTFAILILMNIVGIRKYYLYGFFGLVLWIFMYKSGIHATIAGILTAMTIPSSSKYKPRLFSDNARKLLDEFDNHCQKNGNILSNSHMAAVLQTLERGINRAQTPLQNLEHSQHTPVNFLVIPIFALANAAIPVDIGQLGNVLSDPITTGIMVGLILGKPIGITLATWLSVKAGICTLPAGTTMHHIIGAGCLAGIGFTMSIFITELAFAGQKETLIIAKTGILFASILSAVIGFVYLLVANKRTKSTEQEH